MNAHHRLSPTEVRIMLREGGYHPVPVTGPEMNIDAAGKRPTMSRWQQICLDANPEEIARWAVEEPECVNTGLLTGTLIGADVDVLDTALADTIAGRARQILGPTPLVRIGREPKVLLAYRLPGAIDKLQTPELHFTDNPAEKGTKIEVLARGQQFVGFGRHPDTRAPYRWPDSSPLDLRFNELPETNEAALRDFVAEAEAILRAAGAATRADRKREHRGREDKGRRAGGFGPDEKPDRETIAEALDHIPNDFDYDGWVRIGFALYDGLGEAGRDLWGSWSAGSPRNDPAFTARKWPTFASGRHVTVATLFWHAHENGWRRAGRSGAPKRDRAERRASAGPAAEGGEDGRPIVRFVAGKVPEAVDRMEAILIEAGVEIYSRANSLVRPALDTMPAARGHMTVVARMCPLTTVSLADLASRTMRFQRFDGRSKDFVDINVPIELTTTLLAREGQWRVPAVVGTITTPTLRADGSLLSAPGYDLKTRLYLALDPGFTMPALAERPTKADAEAALALLEGLLTGFPFVGPTDKAVALSAILTGLVRGVLPTAPLHGVSAHTAGTGKSYFVDLVSVIATGRRCPVIAAGKTEEETEKRLGALLRDGAPIVSLDNITTDLSGDFLCQLTERPLVRVRILGKSEAPEIECRALVLGNGNNLVVGGDMTRRAVICSLDAAVDRPELREFERDPIAEVLADRGRFVAAALTIIGAYRTAGFPKVCGPIGSYEEWSQTVRSPLIWLGQVDPVQSMERAREEDPELASIKELFTFWRTHLLLSESYTTNSLIKTAIEKSAVSGYDYNTSEFVFPEFRDLLLRQAGEGGAINSRRLGKWLSKIKGRVVDGYRIGMKVDDSHGNRFTLRSVADASHG